MSSNMAGLDLRARRARPVWRRVEVVGVLLLASLLFVAGITGAQSDTTSIAETSEQRWVHRKWTVADGLPVNVLTGIAQDDHGYLWIGTGDGLVRFDGNRFVTLRPAQEPALGSPRISDVVRDAHNIWVLTAAGLTRLRGGELEAVRPSASDDGRFIGLRRQAGRLWALAEHALYEVGADGELQRAEEVPQDHGLLDLFIDRAGRRWLLTTDGIAWREGANLRWYLTSATVHGAVETDRGIVFFRQDLPPLLYADGVWEPAPEALVPGVRLIGTSTVATAPWGTTHIVNRDLTLRTDGRQHALLDTVTSSFVVKSGFAFEDPQTGRWTATGPEVQLNGETVLEVAEGSDAGALEMDREGTIWVASSRDGLHALTPAAVRMIDRDVGLNPPNVYGVYADRSGALWLGTLGGGAWRGTPAGWTRVSVADNPDAPVFARSFLDDGQGTVWVGLIGGVYSWSGDRLEAVEEQGVPRVRTNAFALDDLGRLWVGTADGLYRRDLTAEGPIWRPVQVDGRSLGEVRSLLWSPDGELWVAGVQGLARFDGARWRRIERADGLPTNLTRSLTLDARGVLWVGTDDSGLLRLESIANAEALAVQAFGPEQGLDTTNVHSVLEDGAGFLWLSSNSGIYRVKTRDLDQVAAGRRDRVRSSHFDELDGLNNREANGGTDNAGLRTADGRLWFATQDGVAVIDPDALLPSSPVASATVIEGVRVEQTLRALEASLTLAADERTFTVLYTAPAPSAARRARFRYRLVGFDDRWSEAGARREAIFTKVPGGTYVFEVETLGIPGLLEASRASVPIEVLPNFRETPWFRALAALAAFALLAVIVLWRDRSHRRRRRELEAIVGERTAVVREQAERLRRLDRVKSDLFTDVSHEFRTPLTLAIGPLQDLLDGVRGDLEPPAREEVALALRNTRRLLALVNQILDVARMEAGQIRLARERLPLAPFLHERLANFTSLANHEGVELEFETPVQLQSPGGAEDDATQTVDRLADFDRNRLGRAIDNLLLNALQWTPAGGRICMRLAVRAPTEPGAERQAGVFEISVQDTGPGIARNDLERIFLRFQRGGGEPESSASGTDDKSTPEHVEEERSNTKRRGGTGIGLAQTLEIARLHGGTLEVESVEGEGATFRFLLPTTTEAEAVAATSVKVATTRGGSKAGEDREGRKDADVPPAVDDQPLPESGDVESSPDHEDPGTEDERPLVLVVDDEPEVRDYVRRTLEPDYRVVVAGDGEEALVRARSEVPDAVVSDVMMPKMDGFAGVAEFHRDPELDFVPIVLLTARGADDARLEALGLGADHYLVKPFLRRELRGRIHNLLTRRKQWSAPPPSNAEGASEPVLHLPEVEPEPADVAFLRRVVALVDEGLGDPELDVEELASRLHCDRTYLFRKLRGLTGETPSALLRRVRLERAEQLLRGRAGNVSEVAYAVGFRSVSHFSRTFREQFGVTPSQIAGHHQE